MGIVHSDYAWASHPAEVRTLVKDGFGFALVREGTVDDPELVTRTVAGTDWRLGSSLVYNLYGFWNEKAFLTKSGDLGMVLRVPGVDYRWRSQGHRCGIRHKSL